MENKLTQFGVAVKAVIFNEDKFLILKRSDTDKFMPSSYDLPGGKLELGETPELGLKREILEETGLYVAVNCPSRIWTFEKKDLQVVGITFHCKLTGGKESLSFEHADFEWMDLEKFKTIKAPKWLKEEIEAAFKLNR